MTEPVKTPEQQIAELTAKIESLNSSLLQLMADKRTLEASNRTLSADLTVAKHKVTILIEGLQFYKPGPFWDTVVKQTKADEDQGKHAAWILRMADSDSSEAA